MSTLGPSYSDRLDALAKSVAAYNRKGKKDALANLLKDVAAVVREAEASSAPELADIVDKAGEISDRAIHWAYGDGKIDFLPSFAHAPGVGPVEDPMQGLGFANVSSVVQMVENFFLGGSSRARDTPEEPSFLPTAWTVSHSPHPKSTRLSRFRDGVTVSATNATPLAQTILQARCEVSADSVNCPIDAAISSDSSALAVIGQAGWKYRDPTLTVFLLDEGKGGDRETRSTPNSEDGDAETWAHRHFTSMVLEPGLSEIAYAVSMDAVHKLTLVADTHRIKTFYYGHAGDVKFGDWAPARGKNVHTLNSKAYTGPIAALPGGRIARAGIGSVAIWDIDRLATHKGGKRVGRGKFDTEHSWRENEFDEIELSTGSEPTTVVNLDRDVGHLIAPGTWQHHEPTGRMLVGESGKRTQGHYGCFVLDLEHGGKKAMRFLGHGGHVQQFSVSAGDPNVFATAGGDGYARLFDVRHPLPVMTFDHGRCKEFCMTVELIHPDGVPVLFSTGSRSQNIKVWDVRAGAAVYELGTGNTIVHAFSWDAKRNALWATTECDYLDRLGYTHGYRPARIPGWAKYEPEETKPTSRPAVDDDDDYDSEEDEDYGDGRHNWPDMAPHDEMFFGYAYDAGDHSLRKCRYTEDPDPKELPEYGDARLDGDGFW
ncbi:hypothetical protein C8T65DRAFT_637110 [Cerioporus squamosus]|nr:hypothetical protein C8T65DRAFT_637110 [Cerioporus squamosus]